MGTAILRKFPINLINFKGRTLHKNNSKSSYRYYLHDCVNVVSSTDSR